MSPRNGQFDFDFIVIGSGFGGSVSAHRLVEKGYRVAVMEMGRRWTPDSLPRTSWSIRRWLWRPKLGLHGFFNMQFFRHVTIFHGCAVGGGSITYACTLLPPPEKVWEAGSWTGLRQLESAKCRSTTKPPHTCWASLKTESWVQPTFFCSEPPKPRVPEILSIALTWEFFRRQRDRPATRPFPIHSLEEKARREPPASAVVGA